MRPTRTGTRRRLPGSPFNTPEIPPPPVEVFAVQDWVSHDKYGLGRVIHVEQNSTVLVDFGAETYRIVPPYTKLQKL
ncbi:hypothetical protein E1286_06255 [Nonomuraea terrae]|uniref:ATP-dependent DNA helicase II n=1 Tax=Nonomuraea terrae TaxID=2530383 RepID=A0A4R4Z8T2_9ACTN|nr:hypothetical protein E1286_06255 [Nonomuraea terrae]